jgi:hypothetical protein
MGPGLNSAAGDANLPPRIAAPPPRRRRRWWFYALVGLGALAGAAVALVIAGVLYFNSLVRTYTDPAPRPLARIEAPPEAMAALKSRWESFAQSVAAGVETPPFKLSADDLNVLMASNPELKDRLCLTIHSNTLTGEFTVPLDQKKARDPGKAGPLQGRHLNGRATFKLEFEEGFLNLTVASVEARDKPIPAWLLRRLQRENFLKDLDGNRAARQLLDKMDNVTVQDGSVVFTPLATK